MAKATTKKAKALAERGTFKPQDNTDYPDPYSVLTYAAVRPYVSRSAASVAVWGDTLPSLVPPAFAVRYQELRDELDANMRNNVYKEAQRVAASLCKALDVMDEAARSAGHLPPVIDGHLVEHGDSTYAFIASGSVREVRTAHPTWLVYHLSDVAAVLSGTFAQTMAKVANAFPDAKITKYTPATSLEDDIDL
jgi:hypothetical protein